MMASFSKEMTKKISYNAISNIADIAGMIVVCAGDFPRPKMWKL
jgi:hypothetical protein